MDRTNPTSFDSRRLAKRILIAVAVLLPLPGWPGDASAMCDVIPGTSLEFRGALGTLNRPFSIPGDDGQLVSIRLRPDDCAGVAGFPDLGAPVAEDDYFVTILFKPTNAGPRNAIVLTTEGKHDL